jgi:hypothetical protein
MSTAAPVIQYLKLDAQYDPIFDPTQTLSNLDAVAQAILTRLNLFLGEWWENLAVGLPVFQSMLGQLGSKTALNAMQLAVQQNVAGTPYVISVTAITVTFIDGQFNFTASANTVFGPVTVSNAPGLQASLGGQVQV